jgi:hypothetical protein
LFPEEKYLMLIARLICSSILAAVLVVPALAQGTPTQGGAASQDGQKFSGKKMDYSPFFEAVDKNHDGKLTREEWNAAGLKDKQFIQLTKYPIYQKNEKSDEQYVAKAYFEDMDSPAELDANKDGKVTLEEFINFTKNIAFECPGPGCAPDPSNPLPEGSNPAHDRK